MRLRSFLLAVALCLSGCSTVFTPGATLGGSTTLSPTAPSDLALVGTWEATHRSHDGLGETLLLSSHGALTIVMGTMISAQYRLDGTVLTSYDTVSGAGAPNGLHLAFTGDTVLISTGSSERKLVPLRTSVRPHRLVGQWRYVHVTGIPAYEEYGSEGTMRRRVPMQVRTGFFFIRNDELRLVLHSPRMEERGTRFTVRGDTLTLRGTTWRRMIAPWSTPYRASFRGDIEVFVRARQLIPFDIQPLEVPGR